MKLLQFEKKILFSLLASAVGPESILEPVEAMCKRLAGDQDIYNAEITFADGDFKFKSDEEKEVIRELFAAKSDWRLAEKPLRDKLNTEL